MEHKLMIEISKDEYKELKAIELKYNNFKLIESLKLATTMKDNAANVNAASQEKVSEIEKISSLVNEFIEKSNQIEIKSKENFNSSESSNNESQNIIILVEELTNTIHNIDSAFDAFTNTINSLTTANHEITELVAVNDKISFQTNLLSINAKIEASRAGDAGKGFSIVADEVKKLAASSKHSTQEIGKKIEEISAMTQNAKEQSDQSNELIDNSARIVSDATKKLNYLIQLSSKNKNDSIEVQNIVDNQLKDSDTIKTQISELLNDTLKAIDISYNNINLGNQLVKSLS
ncbi:methyl-accepting chemotaxis protein [Arcobacteraceae bacterium]|nr:methyl-accepting chemotaxis protein [Arcobacteraceae bacterium]